jgi:peptidoglycan/xylan/chitin deacetylase (PgdA/CDA1 family)
MLIEGFVVVWVVLLWWLGVGIVWTMVMLALLLGLAFFPPRALLDRLSRASGGRVIFRVPPGPRGDSVAHDGRISVYLTIDDAPTAHTHHILLALEECGQGKAMFFVIGDYALAAPEALRDIVRAGHALGNHDSANRLTAAPWRSMAALRAGLKNCADTVDHILASSPKSDVSEETEELCAPMHYMRPGCGLYNATLVRVAERIGYQTLLGDTYGHDCQMGWWPAFLRWFYRVRVRTGSIIILHDGTEQRARNTAAVIRELYVNANVRFVPLPTHLRRPS